MVTYAKEEMVGITELGKSLGSYLDKVTANTLGKLVIIRRNKPEAVIIPIHEYELLQQTYDRQEQQKITDIADNMSDDDKSVSHSKVLEIEL